MSFHVLSSVMLVHFPDKLLALVVGPGGGVSKLYEAQERAVLNEYHDVLLKLMDRAAQKQKEAQQAMPQPSREPHASTASRPLSAPAHLTDVPQQQSAHGPGAQGIHSSYAPPVTLSVFTMR